MKLKSRSVGFRSSGATDAAKGRTFIFAIGIDRYQHLDRLYNAENDVNGVVALLTDKYQFDPARVETLLNERATRDNILSGLRSLVKKVSAKDTLLIYYAGHGKYDEEWGEGYWVPVEGHKGNTFGYVSNSEIIHAVERIPSLHTLLISDSCFAEKLFAERSIEDRLEIHPSRWVMTSGRDGPVSDGLLGEHSPFAHSILVYLEKNTKPAVPVTNLFQFVKEVVGSNNSQIPRCEPLQGAGHSGGEFVFRLKDSHVSLPADDGLVSQPVYNRPAVSHLGKVRAFWQRPALWIFSVLGVLIPGGIIWWWIGHSRPEPPPPPPPEGKATIALDSTHILLSGLKPKEERSFEFTVHNPDSIIARIDSVHYACEQVKIDQNQADSILPYTFKIYRATWTAAPTAGKERCALYILGQNIRKALVLEVEAVVITNKGKGSDNPKPPPKAMCVITCPTDIAGIKVSFEAGGRRYSATSTGRTAMHFEVPCQALTDKRPVEFARAGKITHTRRLDLREKPTIDIPEGIKE